MHSSFVVVLLLDLVVVAVLLLVLLLLLLLLLLRCDRLVFVSHFLEVAPFLLLLLLLLFFSLMDSCTPPNKNKKNYSPHTYYSDPRKAWVRSSEYQYYVYQTQMGLPSNWTTYYDRKTMSVKFMGNVLKSSRSICKKPPGTPESNKPEIVFSTNLKADSDLHK